MRLRFTKMHGLGNDFVMIDGISQRVILNPDRIRFIANRNFGIGCDQVLLVEPPTSTNADFRYRIFNQDGGEVENCGNGARCFAAFVRQRGLTHKKTIIVDTAAGQLSLQVKDNLDVCVDMGAPILQPHAIPFEAPTQAPDYAISVEDANHTISAVSMGNPHAVLFVDDVKHAPVESLGPKIESHALFPNRVNAGFAQIISRNEIHLRVFERGAGETTACGTGACAAVVAGICLGNLDREVKVNLPGGALKIEWAGGNAAVMMTGPATTVFHGQIKL